MLKSLINYIALYQCSVFHVCWQGGKLVAAVAPTTTLPQLSNQNELKNSHQKQHHDNDANTLPQLNKKSESYTRQSSYSTINTGTPDRTKRDAYGNKLPMTPGGNDLFMISYWWF